MASSSVNYTRRHLRFGWWALFIFLAMGIFLEALHGFKIGFYLDVSNESRRFMWRLAHAHGAFFALINIAFALTLKQLPGDWSKLPSSLLRAATIIMPGGFFIAGWGIKGGDPGPGVILVPVGALCLLVSVALIAAKSGKTETTD